jgi:AcrR family transcriptional regulator
MGATDTRERILRATVTTLATLGFARTTARAIATTGGFAAGVIYYHHTDLDDVFIATARYVSDQRLARYQAETAGVADTTELMHRLRWLYDEDVAEGHIAAVQELVAGAAGVPRLAEQVREEIARWHEFAEGVLRTLLAGTPFAGLLPLPELAAAAVAMYLGLEMLSHLHAERYGPDAMFSAGLRIASLIDAITPTA